MTYAPLQPGRQIPGRRDLLKSWCLGFGGLALADLLNAEEKPGPAHPLAAKKPHFKPRAKRIIFLFMHGGPSHIDLFDPKPELQDCSYGCLWTAVWSRCLRMSMPSRR